MSRTGIEFTIDTSGCARRELAVRLRVDGLDANGAEHAFFLPTWTPGSYLVREYARHLSRVEAFGPGGEQLPCRKAAKNRFVVTTDGATAIELRYRVYAHELSVRTAHADAERVFWTPTCVLLWPDGRTRDTATIHVHHPSSWSVHCSLDATSHDESDGSRITSLQASDLHEALDAPVLVGAPERLEWRHDGVQHAIVLDGLGPIAPPPTLVSDLDRIVSAAKAVFGGPLPYRRYLFQALFSDEGYGGLEHRDSTTLLMPRTKLASDAGYREFLALAAHELFHAWNVKRMRPVEFWDYDYERENYTRLLWLMEGWTAYYDDLLVTRAGLMSHDDYLATMAKNVQNMRNAPGRFAASLEESSFDAWIRLYRPDENTRNSSQNYYGNGAIAALCLDLLIRRRSDGRHSLDDVLANLYRSTFGDGRGYRADDVYRIVGQLAGDETVAMLHSLVEHELDPALDELLVDVGVTLEVRDQDLPYFGVAFESGTTNIASVTRTSPAYDGGLAPGDELLAIGGLRTTAGSWQKVFGAIAAIDTAIDVLVARRGVLQTLSVTPSTGLGKVRLRCNREATPPQLASRRAWLGDDTETDRAATS